MTRITFRERLSEARAVEKKVAEYFQGLGHRVLPVYDYSGLSDGKAPKLQSSKSSESLVTPDLLLAKEGICAWIEVKMKGRADYTRMTDQLETGISLRLWDHYLRVQECTGIEVWLLFIHKAEKKVVGECISVLKKMRPRFYTGHKMGPSGMVFFPFDRLQDVCTYEEMVP